MPGKPSRLSEKAYIEGILKGDRVVLSRAITLIESSLPSDRTLAQSVINGCISHSGKSFRLGISGVPGVGKSTFIDSFGSFLLRKNHKVAVLAIDPSSTRTGGSILGDKTRMNRLAQHPDAFVRPSPSTGTLGGVTTRTRETMILCEAAGYDHILVETVGVGQSETVVASMTDFFLVLMLPHAGDDLQGIKRGIIEMADGLVINKADGKFLPSAKSAKTVYSQALHMFPAGPSQWIPQVLTCSSTEETGLDEIYRMLNEYQNLTQENGFRDTKRKNQSLNWMEESVNAMILDSFYQSPEIREKLSELKNAVINRQKSPVQAASELIQYWRKT